MRQTRIYFTLAAILAGASATRAADTCPGFGEERLAAIAAAPGCKAASRINDACSMGSGGDTVPTMAVIEKCEKDFIGKAPKARIAAYQRERAACRRKYSGKSCTMYVSFTVCCEARVAVKYSGK